METEKKIRIKKFFYGIVAFIILLNLVLTEKNIAGGDVNNYFVTFNKIDGVAVSLTYKDGILQHAVTRGNGVQGDIITQNILHLDELPKSIASDDSPSFIEIRGEIFMEHQEFLRINQEREFAGEPLYANPRNLAAGTVKLLDPKEARRRKLKIVLYGLGACEPTNFFETQTGKLFTQCLRKD